MGDFQKYLDNALKKLDVNDTKNNDSLPKYEYDITDDISEFIHIAIPLCYI